MSLKPVNNCTTQLINDLAAAATVMSVVTTQKMPALGASDYVYATLLSIGAGFDNFGNPNLFEIVKIVGPLTPGAGQTVTIVRAQDGTAAAQFTAGDVVDLRVNRATLLDAASATVPPYAVNVANYGAVGDGVTDDTNAFVAAFAALGTLGGRVWVPSSFRCLINTLMNVPPGCCIVGPHVLEGGPYGVTLSQQGGTLILNGGLRLLGGSAGIQGLILLPKGLTFPQVDNTNYTGTAVFINGDDMQIRDCLIVGFDQAMISNTPMYRPRIQNVLLDCNKGIDISASPDVVYIDHVEQFPFGTANGGGGPNSGNRPGPFMNIHDTVDGVIIISCFCWACTTGYEIKNINSATLIACRGDLNSIASSICYRIEGTTAECRLIGCMAAGCDFASVYQNSAAGYANVYDGCNFWTCANNGHIVIDGGNARIVNNTFRDAPNGIVINNATSVVSINENIFQQIASRIFSVGLANPTVFIGPNNNLSAQAVGFPIMGGAGSVSPQVVASAAAMNIPGTGDVFSVTGTVGITTMLSGFAGRRVTLIFAAVLTVTHSIGANGFALNAGGNFVTGANSTLTVVFNGTQWFEVGRKV